jgi:hypothetical protein
MCARSQCNGWDGESLGIALHTAPRAHGSGTAIFVPQAHLSAPTAGQERPAKLGRRVLERRRAMLPGDVSPPQAAAAWCWAPSRLRAIGVKKQRARPLR